MTRALLDTELHELDARLIRLGSLVEQALTQVLEALETGDHDKACAVVVAENTIDTLHLALQEHTFRVLNLQQLLAGRDLRYLTSILPMSIDLERIGDEADGIAQIFLRMVSYHYVGAGTPSGGQGYLPPRQDAHLQQTQEGKGLTGPGGEADQFPEDSLIRRIIGVGQEARSLLQRTMPAFVDRDAQAARSIWEEDNVVDKGHYLVSRDLMAMLEGPQAIPALQHDPYILQRATYMLWIVHKFECVADHCTNICERIVFTVEGQTDIYTTTLER